MKKTTGKFEFLCLSWAVLALFLAGGVVRAAEQSFKLLQIGTRSYTNVTVTTKTPTYIFILHSRGMESIKVKDLPTEALVALGYLASSNSTTSSNTLAAQWTKQTLAKIETPQVKELEKRIPKDWTKQLLAPLRSQNLMHSWMAQTVLGLAVVLYVFFCYCCRLICLKAGREASPLVWVPVLQNILLLQAAGMSGWWVLTFFVPFLGILTHIIWSVKMVNIRGKSPLLTLCLILPGINFLAFLYLAFSDSEPPQAEPVKAAKPEEEPIFAIRV
jgi:succinate dehydrogenase hydrophobic anchor subunit